jgi:glycerol uptake facilitator-like aquaporin
VTIPMCWCWHAVHHLPAAAAAEASAVVPATLPTPRAFWAPASHTSHIAKRGTVICNHTDVLVLACCIIACCLLLVLQRSRRSTSYATSPARCLGATCHTCLLYSKDTSTCMPLCSDMLQRLPAVCCCCTGLGGPTGYAANPARDLGPRLAHALLPIPGKGSSEWSYAWIPSLAPLVGGVIAGVLYIAIEEMQFPGGGTRGVAIGNFVG